MGEPLSVTASLIAIVQVSGSVISLCYHYSHGVKDAPRDVKRTLNEVRSTRDITERILQMIDDDTGNGYTYLPLLRKLSGPDGAFAQCAIDLKWLEERLSDSVGQWRRFGKRLIWPLVEKEVDKRLQSISRIKDNIELSLLADTASSILEIRTTTLDLHKRILEAQRIASAKEEQLEFSVILEWLAAPDQSVKMRNLLAKREPGTVTWFLDNQDYQTWKTAPQSSLWLHGIPGCGKSVVAAVATNELLQVTSSNVRSAVAYFQFDFSDKEHSTIDVLLRSLLAQVMQQTQGLSEHAEKLAAKHFGRSAYAHPKAVYRDGIAQPDANELLDTLMEIIGGEFDNTYIVIDAVDEAEEVAPVLTAMQELLRYGCDGLHLLLVSRDDIDVQSALDRQIKSVVSVEPAKTDTDIAVVVQNELMRQPRLRKWSPVLKQEIQGTLIGGSNGMFRWAECVLELLAKCLTVKDIKKTLTTLPKTLAETYKATIERIDENHIPYAAKLLMWLTISHRPLLLEEAVDILAIEFDPDTGPTFDADLRFPNPIDIIEICTALVSKVRIAVTGCDGVVRESYNLQLAHRTVKDFLRTMPFASISIPTGLPIDMAVFLNCAARGLLAYLLQLEEELTVAHMQEWPLLRFAAEYWTVFHKDVIGNVRSVNDERLIESSNSKDDHSVTVLATRLFAGADKDVSYHNWCKLYDPERPWKAPNLGREARPEPIYYAACLDHPEIVRQLLAKGVGNPDTKGGMHRTPLQAAAYHNNVEVFRMLLAAGPSEDNIAWVIDSIARHGNHSILEAIDDHQIKTGIEVRPMEGTSLLQAAAGGHTEIVKRLLRLGADPNYYARKGEFHNPLVAAVENGHKECVAAMLGNCSNQTAIHALRDGTRHNKSREMLELFRPKVPDAVMYYALVQGEDDLASGLLAEGFRGEFKQQNYGQETRNSALVEAARHGHRGLVEDLLNKGAKVNSENQRSYAVCKAAKYGHTEVVRLLLEHGADTEPTHSRDGPALQCAAYGGHLETMQALLDAGANVQNPDGRYGGPVQAAVLGGHVAALDLLIDAGANINMPRGHAGTLGPDVALSGNPLKAAVRTSQTRMVDWLLEHGADPNGPPDSGSCMDATSPLMIASGMNDVLAIERLIEAGAEVNKFTDCAHSTALFAAVSHNHPQAVEHLLSLEADPNSVGKPQYYDDHAITVLAQACTLDDPGIVGILLKAGADVNKQSIIHRHSEYPMHTAARSGPEETITMLRLHGANVNEQVKDGWSALHCAAREGNERNVRALLSQNDADPSIALVNGSQPIHSAAVGDSVGCIKALLEAGVDVNVRNRTGRTPLHWAAESGSVKAVKFLLKNGADWVAEEEAGLTARDLAELKKQEEAYFLKDRLDRIIDLLQEGGRGDGGTDPTASDDDEDSQTRSHVTRIGTSIIPDVSSLLWPRQHASPK
ncbi:Ankyrin repeat-containing protein 10 [Elsinoe fawcettii]|nr:Ankyrin repeat-containing protein 10 [Elsinoe fawcettii]